MPLPLTVSCFSKIQIGFTFLVLAHMGSPGQRAVIRVCVCVCVCVCVLGSVATYMYLRCDGSVNNRIKKGLLLSLSVRKCLKSVNIWQSYKEERGCLRRLQCGDLARTA